MCAQNAAVIPDGVRLDPGDSSTPPPAPPPSPSRMPATSTRGRAWTSCCVRWPGCRTCRPASWAGNPGDRPRAAGCARTRPGHPQIGSRSRAGCRPPRSSSNSRAPTRWCCPTRRTHTSERYTSPLKLFEYLAAGRPIVASDLAALREVLRHDDTALLVEPGRRRAAGRGSGGSWATGHWRRACPVAPSRTRIDRVGDARAASRDVLEAARARAVISTRCCSWSAVPTVAPASPTAATR